MQIYHANSANLTDAPFRRIFPIMDFTHKPGIRTAQDASTMIGRLFLRRYLAVSFLSRGNAGSIYLARDQREPRVVVVKVMHPHVAADPTYRRFLEGEVESLSRLRHPNIVELFDVSFDDPAGPCLVMEFIPGVTLDHFLQRHCRLSLTQTASLLVPLCRALDAGHTLAITHRDLKPANLMVVNPDTPQQTLKVMDFGFSQQAARPYLPLDRLRGSTEFAAFGTPLYLAPECARGDPVDFRADLYSVGVILFELLTGSPPFTHTDCQQLVAAHVHETPPTFTSRKLDSVYPPEVERVVRWCLAKYPNERPQSAKELLESFSKAAGIDFDADWFSKVNPMPAQTVPSTVATPCLSSAEEIHDVLDAWMPEPVAILKFRGFVNDHCGEVISSEPGRIHVRFTATPKTAEKSAASLWRFLGAVKEWAAPPDNAIPAIDMRLILTKKCSNPPALTELKVIATPSRPSALLKSEWRTRAQQLLNDLRAYLMAK